MNRKQKIAGTPQEHPLPRVHSITSYMVRGTALVLLLSVVGLPVNFALGGTSAGIVSTLLVAGEMMSLLCLPFAWLAHRGVKKAIRQILTEKQTVHWTYSPAEWQLFTTLAWRQSMRSNLVVTAIIWASLVVGFFLASSANVLAALAWGTGVAVLWGLLLFLPAVAVFQGRRRRTSGDVYISRAGIIRGGWYYKLSDLRRVTYKAGDPGVLSFVIGWGRSRRVLEVPVPHGREAEAQQVTWSRKYS